MEILKICMTLVALCSAAHSASILQRRDAFNPNRLMDNYMGMRTDQTSFGSFHPNDLVKTIQTYFQHGGTQLLPNNQWGLAVYNPNEAIEQYVGQLDSAGALGPEVKEPEVVKENRVAHVTGFNPDQLNKMLLGGMESETLNPATKTSDQYGFDADNVNRQLMQDINNSQQGTDSTTPATALSGGYTTQKPNSQNDGFGFNANELNANLFSGMEYDPNAVMPGMIDFQDNAASTTESSQGTESLASGFNPSTPVTNIGLTGSNLSAGNQAGNNMPGNAGQNGGIFAGNNAGTVPPAVSNGGSTGGNFSPGGLGGSSNGAQGGTATGSQGGIYAGSNAGTVPPALNNAGSTGGNFNPGGLGGSSNGSQGGAGTGTQGGSLTQTGVAIPAPSGIGAIGGR